MTLTEVKQIVKTELGNFLENYGYKFDSKAYGFLRYFEGGFNKVGISIVDYQPKFKLSFFFCVRLDEVENILQQYVFILEKYRDFTWTLNIPIEHFTCFKEYAFDKKELLLDLLHEIEQVYSTNIDDFLKSNSSVDKLDVSLNINPSKLGYMTTPEDFIRRIIIAKLAGNTSFDDVADWYYKKYVEDYFLDTEEGPNKISEVTSFLRAM
jgi:hypothetical protein